MELPTENISEVLKVLVVEDETTMAIAAKRTLENFTFTMESITQNISLAITITGNVQDTLAKLSDEHFDIILLDYKLPDGTGIDILHLLKEREDSPLVVMMTAYANFETAVLATKLGAFDFLPKPFSIDELRVIMKKAGTHLLLTRHAKKFEEERKKIRFNFISILSHELKAPIGAIEGYLNILESDNLKISDEDYSMMISRSKERLSGMRKLIWDLLDLTRIESGEKNRSLKKCDLIIILKEVKELLQAEADKRKITIEMIHPKELWLMADALEIQIVLTNLISNAIKYNKMEGRVEIIIEDNDTKIDLQVKDTGIGIAKEDLGRLFSEFVRLKNENTVHILGSGLGLSTIRKVAALYKGDARVESIEGCGSTFYVTLYKNSSET